MHLQDVVQRAIGVEWKRRKVEHRSCQGVWARQVDVNVIGDSWGFGQVLLSRIVDYPCEEVVAGG
jgi:hypothetical protein